MKIELALLSVSDKEGIVEFARQLVELGLGILSTGGTGKALESAGIRYTPVSRHTGFPEILDGRVKTLHPRIHAGILARHDDPEHQRVLQDQQIPAIGLVVVNLYPFVQTTRREGVTLEEAVENIDIGGPALIRAAAKNFNTVTVVVDPFDYADVWAELRARDGRTTADTRFRLAQKAFSHTAAYDGAISNYLGRPSGGGAELPAALHLDLIRLASLRYGENPHQRAALYRSSQGPLQGVVAAEQLQGKQLSFNNYIDLSAAWELAIEFSEPACTVIKHSNPCGTALGKSPREAFEKAVACDPVSAFGSIIGFNRSVDGSTARAMSELFVEAVIAPEYQPEALEIFGGKKNLRVMRLSMDHAIADDQDVKRVAGGLLVQDRDRFFIQEKDLRVVSARRPSAAEVRDLLFAWHVCKHVKSNAILLARDGQTLGVGAGQMSRVDSVRIAGMKARLPLEGCALASDAFFPFRDGLDEAARLGVRAVIQPGGSVRDQEVIEAADEHGMAMVFTGVRHFKH